ncbi:MAG TPA: PKD domain-containing protein [Sphingobacteriaceae bacterium]
MKKTFLLLAVSAVLVSCKKKPAPISNFSTAKPAYYLSEPVQFTNSSEHADSYKWDFGDGSSSTEQSPTHAYTKGGTFSVKLTANGKTTSEKTIKIHPGKSSYQVVNNTTSSVRLSSYYYDGQDVLDLLDHGLMSVGSKSDTVFTSRNEMRLGGRLFTTTFIVVNPYPMTMHGHALVTLSNNTGIFTGSASAGDHATNLKSGIAKVQRSARIESAVTDMIRK